MKTMRSAAAVIMLCAVGFAHLAAILRAAPPNELPDRQQADPKAGVETKHETKNRVAVETARDRAENMHELYEATLEMLHHRYFHRDRSLLPARAMEDIFDDMKRRTNVEARWIAVNLKAMSIDHEPKSDFEKKAAREIASGKPAFEAVEGDYYRRASAIPLKAGCVGCHGGSFAAASKSPRFAGLVISVPLDGE